MLDPPLTEENHQEESKLQHTEHPSVQSFSLPCYTEKTVEVPHRQTPAPNLLRKCRPTEGQLVGHKTDFQNLRTRHTSLRKELTKQLPVKDRKKKKLENLSNHLARLRQSFCLNTNTGTGC
jgi:hypothetical protein